MKANKLETSLLRIRFGIRNEVHASKADFPEFIKLSHEDNLLTQQ